MPALSFASPWFLAGLAALIIPFLLLLTKAHVTKTTQFSSVQFLWAITSKASNVIEWKKILLLITRLLILALLAAGFALPFINDLGLAFGGAFKPHYVFILDNSYSMAYREKDAASLMEEAKAKILAAAENVKKPALWSLYLFSREVHPVLERIDSKETLIQEVEKLGPSDFSSDFSALVPFLKDFISSPKMSRDFVYVISDFNIADGGAAEEFEKLTGGNVFPGLRLIAVRPQEFRNISLTQITIPPRPLLPGVSESFFAVFESHGARPGTEISARLAVEGEAVSEQSFEIGDESRGVLKFEHTFPAEGMYPLEIEISSDGLLPDNKRFAIAEVRAALKLLLIEDEIYDFPFQNPYFYLNQTLLSYGVDASSSWVNIERIPRENLGSIKLENYDAVFSADVYDYSPSESKLLKSYVEKGGILFFAAGPRYAPDSTKSNEALNDLLGGYFGEIKSASGTESFHFDTVDYSYPLFNVFEEGRKGNLSSVRLKSFAVFYPLLKDHEYDVPLWIGQKWHGLIKRDLGEGKLFIWTTSLNADWTDFPKNPLYVPFIFELLKQATGSAAAEGLTVGKPFLFQSSGEGFEQMVIKKPDGEQISLYGSIASAMTDFPTDAAGIYYWYGTRGSESGSGMAAFNVDPSESSAVYVKVPSAAGHDTLQASAGTGNEKDLVREMSRNYVYRPLFYAVFILLMMETWLANRFYKPQWV